jgi:hypothetical protein
VFTPESVIITLKVAVSAVTLLLLASLAALVAGNKQLHGRINVIFFILTLTTVLGFEVVIRLFNPDLTAGFSDEARRALTLHLCFSVPAAIILPVMLITGKRYPRFHRALSVLFAALWAGTFISGVFFLPHSFEG